MPGHLIRSVYTARDGQPSFGAGTFTTDQASPFKERWGGWCVTGTHGTLRHIGNVLIEDQEDPRRLNTDDGANVTDLRSRVNISPYLTPHSDIAALMVLEHQTQMHNLITRARYETTIALYQQRAINKVLERSLEYQSDSTQRRIRAVGDDLLEYLLFAGEFRWNTAIQGTSNFANDFAAAGPRDHQGRSLRDLDLKQRLMKYPCSYLIYTDAFDALPAQVEEYVGRRLREILTGQDDTGEFAHLTQADRRAILEILRDTKPNLVRDPSAG